MSYFDYRPPHRAVFITIEFFCLLCYSFFENKGGIMRAIQFTTDARVGSVIKLGLFSDTHADSPNFDKATFEEHANYCLNDNRYILFDGDIFDGIIRTDKKRAVNSLLESGDNQLNIKLEKVYELLKPYQKQILFFGRGNHEESILKYNGIDILDILAKMLNSGSNHNIVVGNYANFIRFGWTNKSNKMVANYDIFAHHGAGGSAPATKGMLDFNSLVKGVNADLIWIGHKHNSIIDYSAPIMFVDAAGNVVLKNRQCIQTPSYQTGRTIDYNENFAERFYCHTALSGFGELTLTPFYKDEKPQLRTDLKITTRPQAILGTVQSAKIKSR